MKPKIKILKSFITLILTLISLLSLAYAWFLSLKMTEPIEIVSGYLRVSATLYQGIDVNKDGIISLDEYVEVKESINFQNVIPGSEFYFKIDCLNYGTIPGNLSLSIINIVYSTEKLNNKFKLIFLNPVTNEEEEILINGENIQIFENYFLDANTSFTFYFKIIGKEDITTNLSNERLTLTSFLIKLEQIQG